MRSAIRWFKCKLKPPKNVKNEGNKPYFINTQIPEHWAEENREWREQIRKAKAMAEKEGQEVNIEVKQKVVYVNKSPVRKFLQVPKAKDLFVDAAEQEKIDKIKMTCSDVFSKKGSSFTTFAVKCSSMTEIRRAYTRMKQTFPDASSIMAAYRICNGEGYQDDQEYGASSRMAQILANNDIQNIAIFITRYFDGIHIGPSQHTLIKEVAINVLGKLELLPVTPPGYS